MGYGGRMRQLDDVTLFAEEYRRKVMQEFENLYISIVRERMEEELQGNEEGTDPEGSP